MNIGINLLYLLPGVVGGTETYAAGLLQGFAETGSGDTYYIFVNNESKDWPLPDGRFKRVVCNIKAANVYKRYIYEQVVFPTLLKKYDLDLIHSLGYVGPLFTSIRKVVTIHDMNTIGHGRNMPLSRKLLLGGMVKLTAKKYDHIITVSHFSKAELIKYLKINPQKVSVVYEAAGAAKPVRVGSVQETTTSGEKYIVAFSSYSHHKNLLSLIRAFKIVADQLPYKLMLIGHLPQDAIFMSEIREAGLENRIQFTGFVDNAKKNEILQGAEVFVFPSLYEGFGLPLLEAQNNGVCVCSSTSGSLPEIGSDSAVYFDGYSVESMAAAILKLLNDPALRKELVQKGYQNVARFSWANAALETKEVYNNLNNQIK